MKSFYLAVRKQTANAQIKRWKHICLLNKTHVTGVSTDLPSFPLTSSNMHTRGEQTLPQSDP